MMPVEFVLRTVHKIIQPDERPVDGSVLIYANMGYGDLVMYLPVLRSLQSLGACTIICDNGDKKDFLRQMGIKCRLLHSSNVREPFFNYDIVVCHWLQQWTPIVRQIIGMRIPCRIGHASRKKFSWLCTYHCDCTAVHDSKKNDSLLLPFGLAADHTTFKFPKPIRQYDIVISPSSPDARKNWDGFKRLTELLLPDYTVLYLDSFRAWYELAPFLAGARLVIGNDSGIPKIADYLGVPAIQIFRSGLKDSPDTVGLIHRGVNFIDPSVEEIYQMAKRILHPNTLHPRRG